MLRGRRYAAYESKGFWREYCLVRLRAENRCEACGADNVETVFHHKDKLGPTSIKKRGGEVGSVDNSMENIQLLCRSCHADAHGYSKQSGRLGLVLELREQGWTYSRIGKELGLSRQRICQILAKYKLPP